MSYRCGTSGLERFGVPSDSPRIICDGCGYVLRIGAYGPPPAWFLDGKSAPRWRKTGEGETRQDRCPKCKAGNGAR